MPSPAALPDDVLAAAGRFVPVSAYDGVVARTMREQRWRPALVADLAGQLRADAAIADIGAGTGSLTLALRAALPGARISGIEPDERALAIARSKPAAQTITWTTGRAEATGLDDASQDAVVMALMLHHLPPRAKLEALVEARRVLRPGGRLYVADFGRPQDPLMSLAFAVIQIADGRATTAAHRRGDLPGTIATSGFALREPLLRLRTLCGSFDVLRAVAPA